MDRTLAELLGRLIAGLSVPGSLGVLGEADQPWRDLRSRWRLFGYPTAEEITEIICEREIATETNETPNP